MKHLLIILISFLLLSSPVIGQETGVLFFSFENGYSEEGDDDNDGIYVGELKDGKPHGQGTFTFPNGTKYVGEYKDGFPNGQGTLTQPDGSGYVGEVKDGKPHGQGTFTFTSGSKYTGELKDELWNGQGTFTFRNGSKGIGEFRENRPFNITEYDKNGNIIGKYVNGKRIK